MRILIVSFDRGLIRQLRDALSGYEVIDVKNGEEALSLANPYFDIIIYDAISGAISEEDINNMYQRLFKDAKFIVLIDDLFPINTKNLKPQKKVVVARESSMDQILSAITAPIQEELQLPTLEPEAFQGLPPIELEIETHKQIVEEPKLPMETFPTEEDILGTLQLEQEFKPTGAQQDSEGEVLQPISKEEKKKKIAIVSFDSTLVDSIAFSLPEGYEPLVIRSYRDLENTLRDVDGVIFDAISGLTAKRRLVELAKDPEVSQKPFIVLIDDLFNITIEDIPLGVKYSISRDENPKRIAEKIAELTTMPEQKQEEESTLIQMLGELLEKQKSVQEKEETESEELPEIIEELEVPKLEEGPLPMEKLFFEEQKEETTQIPTEESLSKLDTSELKAGRLEGMLKTSSEDIKPLVEVTLREEVRKALEGVSLPQVIKEEVKEILGSVGLDETLRAVIQEEIGKSIQSLPLEDMIKEITYQVLKERLRELIT